MHVPQQTKVVLLAGGSSTEREISLASAAGAAQALETAGYKIEQLDPSVQSDLLRLLTDSFDVAFVCLHGEGGEDGSIQGFLETIGIPYTCSGVRASANCMDKAATKRFYSAASIPTPASLLLDAPMPASEIIAQLGEHCAIKTLNGGSSIGVYIVEGEKEISETLAESFKNNEQILVEQYVAGREITNVVLDFCEEGRRVARALPIIEIIPAGDSYDFDSKYLPGGSQHICPANLSDEETAQVQKLAVCAHEALGCQGVSRTDFILDETGQAWALETNTVPGMTTTSLLPDAARAAGIEFSDLCVQLIEEALTR